MSMTLIPVTQMSVTRRAVTRTNVDDSNTGDSHSGNSTVKWLHYITHQLVLSGSPLDPLSLVTIMPVLETLSTEILSEILACLDICELREVSRVSRFFNRITEPFLYASLGHRRGWLTPTLRTLVARPDLTRHVRRVYFSSWQQEIHPDSEDSDRFSAKVTQLGLKMPWFLHSRPWANTDKPWTIQLLAFLVLNMVPNIQVLEIDKSSVLGSYFQSTLKIPIESLPFKFLRILKFDEYMQYSSVTPPMLLAMMRFPSLRKLIVDLRTPEYYNHDILGTQTSIIAFAGQSAITHLSLHFGGNIWSSTLQHVLQMPRALTHFSYQDDWQYRCQPDGTPFRVALRVLRNTLVSLSIGGVRALRLGKTNEQTIGDFSDWPRLTDVKCTMAGLVGTRATAITRVADMMPMGIREFGLRRSDGLSQLPLSQEWTAREMTDQLVEVVHKRPELMVVTVDMEDTLYYEEMMKRLAVASGTRDVAVVVKTNELFGRV